MSAMMNAMGMGMPSMPGMPGEFSVWREQIVTRLS